jgi:hypothetical protein
MTMRTLPTLPAPQAPFPDPAQAPPEQHRTPEKQATQLENAHEHALQSPVKTEQRPSDDAPAPATPAAGIMTEKVSERRGPVRESRRARVGVFQKIDAQRSPRGQGGPGGAGRLPGSVPVP